MNVKRTDTEISPFLIKRENWEVLSYLNPNYYMKRYVIFTGNIYKLNL